MSGGIMIQVSGYESAPLQWVANYCPHFRFARDASDSTDIYRRPLWTTCVSGLCAIDAISESRM